MKISLNWLKSFIKIDKLPEEIETILTDMGLEVDEVISINSDTNLIKKLIVGKITEIEKISSGINRIKKTIGLPIYMLNPDL